MINWVTTVIFIFFGSVHLFADEAKNTEEVPKKGWTPQLKLATDYSLNSSDNVVGQSDGDSIKVGLSVDSEFKYLKGQNEWKHILTYKGATTKTPTIPRYVKSSDEFKYEMGYWRSLKSYPSLGPFAQVNINTSLFKGEDVQASDKTYVTPDGSFVGRSFRLTDGLRPLTTKQVVGFSYKPLQRKHTKLGFKIGVGAQQVMADNQFKVSETTDTTVTIEALEDVDQVGLDFEFEWKGKWNKNSDYLLKGTFLTPFDSDIEDGKPCADCSTLELTNVDFKLSFGTKLTSWARLAYEYNAEKKPQLLNQFQIKHGVVLNIFYELFK